jgi:hypothetical protein
VFLDVLDDVFLLNLAFESSERALNGFALLQFHLGHRSSPPLDWIRRTFTLWNRHVGKFVWCGIC